MKETLNQEKKMRGENDENRKRKRKKRERKEEDRQRGVVATALVCF